MATALMSINSANAQRTSAFLNSSLSRAPVQRCACVSKTLYSIPPVRSGGPDELLGPSSAPRRLPFGTGLSAGCVVTANELPNIPHIEIDLAAHYAIAKVKEAVTAVTGR